MSQVYISKGWTSVSSWFPTKQEGVWTEGSDPSEHLPSALLKLPLPSWLWLWIWIWIIHIHVVMDNLSNRPENWQHAYLKPRVVSTRITAVASIRIFQIAVTKWMDINKISVWVPNLHCILMLHNFTLKQFSIVNLTADLSWSNQDGIAGTRFTLPNETIKKEKVDKIYLKRSSRQWTLGNKRRCSWERKNKWSKPYDFPRLLLWEPLQALMQGSGAQLAPWIEDMELRLSEDS